jgi:hypothetical protein
MGPDALPGVPPIMVCDGGLLVGLMGCQYHAFICSGAMGVMRVAEPSGPVVVQVTTLDS